jgi:hypothetical protein
MSKTNKTKISLCDIFNNQKKEDYTCLFRSSTEKVETMVVAFWVRYLTNTGAFKKIGSNSSTTYPTMLVELDLYKLTKSTEKMYNYC